MTDYSAHTAYKNFMQRMEKELGISQQTIKNILKAEGVSSYKQLPETELRAILRANAFMESNAVETFTEPPIDYDEVAACLVPDCEGKRSHIANRLGNKWECSIGGYNHFVIHRIASIIMEKKKDDRSIEEVMKTLMTDDNGQDQKSS